jgi:hypothetical protein
MNDTIRDYKSDRYRRIPISEISTPKHGRTCYANSWWEVTPEDEVLFFVHGGACTPQCNTIKSIVERLLIPGCTARFLEMVYLPAECF